MFLLAGFYNEFNDFHNEQNIKISETHKWLKLLYYALIIKQKSNEVCICDLCTTTILYN